MPPYALTKPLGITSHLLRRIRSPSATFLSPFLHTSQIPLRPIAHARHRGSVPHPLAGQLHTPLPAAHSPGLTQPDGAASPPSGYNQPVPPPQPPYRDSHNSPFSTLPHRHFDHRHPKMHPYWYHAHRCGRGTSRLFWFLLGGASATWWYTHHDVHAWQERRACWRDRIPQDAYPAPGSVPPPSQQTPGAPVQPSGAQTQPQQDQRWERWGWGSWNREQQQQQQQENQPPRERWGWGSWSRDARTQQPQQQQQQQQQQQPPPQGARAPFPTPTPAQPHTPAQSPPRWGGPWEREGAWGPPGPLPATMEKAVREEKDIVQQATDTITELSEATLNNLLVTIESLKSKLAEHRAQREQQERELQALREAKFKQFEEWQRHVQEQQAREEQKKQQEPARRLV